MKHKTLVLIITALIVSRLLLLVLGVFVDHGLKQESWVHWDGIWYQDVLENGYDTSYSEFSPEHPSCNEGTGSCQRNFAFFPAYPILVKGFSVVTGIDSAWAGIMLSNLFFVGAGLLLYKLAGKYFGQKVGITATLFLAFFPFSYIFSGLMTESMFLFFLLLTIFLASKEKYFAAGLTGIILSATRNTGVLVVLPLLFMVIEQNNLKSLKSIARFFIKYPLKLLVLALPVLGLLAFSLYLNAQVGDPFAFINVQSYWEKPVLNLNPLFAIFYALVDLRLEGILLLHIIDLAVFSLWAGLFMYALKQPKFPWSLKNIFIWLLVPMTSGSLLAMPRYAAVLFPAYIALALIVSKWKKLTIPAIILCAVLQLILGYFYIKGSWLTV